VIWTDSEGPQQIRPIAGTLYRLVESQEQVATLGYVDTLEEQALLEDLLEAVKPEYPDIQGDYHYLLKTPFRYPPLKWGSRFGRTHEPSLFYGGCSMAATLAESAYYRFVFWGSIEAEAVKPCIRSEHTLFWVDYSTSAGIQLQSPPFSNFEHELTHPTDYGDTQALGAGMREAGVEAFEYRSARAAAREHCVGLFIPNAFTQNQPAGMNQWLCEVSASEVAFKQLANSDVYRFPVEGFLMGQVLPVPA